MLEAPHREGNRKLDALLRRDPTGGEYKCNWQPRGGKSVHQIPSSEAPDVAKAHDGPSFFVFLRAKVEVEGWGEEGRYCL